MRSLLILILGLLFLTACDTLTPVADNYDIFRTSPTFRYLEGGTLYDNRTDSLDRVNNDPARITNNGTTLRVEYNGYVFSGEFASDKVTACLNLVGNPSEYIDVSYTGTDYITTQAIVVSCAPKP